MNRVLGVLAFGCMLAANTALMMRDVLPVWTAGEPPVPALEKFAGGERQQLQTGIYDPTGQRIGTSWSETRRVGAQIVMESFTRLDVIRTGSDVMTPELTIDSRLHYLDDFRLERFYVQVEGFGQLMDMNGRLVPPDDFPCEWRAGERRGKFLLPASATRAMGDAIQPIRQLGKLEIGQSWRIEVFDPLSGTLQGLVGTGMETSSIVVRVADMVNLEYQGDLVRTFLLESDNIRAWVSEDGQALKQEVRLPLIGLFTLLAEPFSFDAREEARYRQFRSPN